MHPKIKVVFAVILLIFFISFVNYILINVHTRFGKTNENINKILGCAVMGTCGMMGNIIIIATIFLLIPQRWISVFDMISQPHKMIKDINGQNRIVPESV